MSGSREAETSKRRQSVGLAAGGQWAPQGDVPSLLREKLAECLWWVLVLADRLDIDMTDAYVSKLGAIEAHLQDVVSRL